MTSLEEEDSAIVKEDIVGVVMMVVRSEKQRLKVVSGAIVASSPEARRLGWA